MSEQRIARLLHACADEAESDPRAGWQAIQARLPRAQTRLAWPARSLRLSLGTGLLAAVLVFSTAAALGASMLDGLLAWHPELRRLQGEERVNTLNLIQERDGYTVTVRGVTADPEAGRIYVIYSVTPPVRGVAATPSSLSPDGPKLQLRGYTLTSAGGFTFTPVLGNLSVDGNTVLTFVAPELRGAPTPLDLRLKLDFALFEFRPAVDAPATPLPGQLASQPHWEPITPFVFDFTVPIAAK
jgi:hypothetical protein